MIEGGKHADSGLAFQEFMVIPQKETFKENLEIGLEIYQKIKTDFRRKIRQREYCIKQRRSFFCPD